MNFLTRTRRLWIVIILGVVLYPFKITVVPTQNVLVMTEDGRAVRNATVRQIWQHYSLESEGHEEDLTTGSNGRLTFPERTIRASLLKRVAYPISNIFREGVHASFGIHTYMFPVTGAVEPSVSTETVKAQPGDVVFHVK